MQTQCQTNVNSMSRCVEIQMEHIISHNALKSVSMLHLTDFTVTDLSLTECLLALDVQCCVIRAVRTVCFSLFLEILAKPNADAFLVHCSLILCTA